METDNNLAVGRFSVAEYYKLVKTNRNYRLYLLSLMCQHAGDWFVRIASLISVERASPGSSTALSIIVMCRTIPEVIVAPFGGILADKFNRKRLMITYDCLAAFSVLGYIYALRLNSMVILGFVTVIRSGIGAAYRPVTQSFVPLIVNNKEDLKRVGTIDGILWSGMLVIGGFVAGSASARFGVEFCYIIDSITYIISALVMLKVQGDFSAKHALSDEQLGRSNASITEFIRYLWHSGFSLLIFLKASGCMMYGSQDVLNASFSNVEGDEAETSRRLGLIYSSIGIGYFFGPIIVNCTIVDGRKIATLQKAVLTGIAFLTVGWLGLGSSSSYSFILICAFTSIREIGTAIIWIFSTVILQNLSKSEFLGRTLGVDFGLARVAETIVAFIAGKMEDSGYTNGEISYFVAAISTFFLLFWGAYHVSGKGAALPKFNSQYNNVNVDEGETSSIELGHEMS